MLYGISYIHMQKFEKNSSNQRGGEGIKVDQSQGTETCNFRMTHQAHKIFFRKTKFELSVDYFEITINYIFGESSHQCLDRMALCLITLHTPSRHQGNCVRNAASSIVVAATTSSILLTTKFCKLFITDGRDLIAKSRDET